MLSKSEGGCGAEMGRGVKPRNEGKGHIGEGVKDTIGWKLGKEIMKRTPATEGIRIKALVSGPTPDCCCS